MEINPPHTSTLDHLVSWHNLPNTPEHFSVNTRPFRAHQGPTKCSVRHILLYISVAWRSFTNNTAEHEETQPEWHIEIDCVL